MRGSRLALAAAGVLAAAVVAEGVLRLAVGRHFAAVYRIDETTLHALVPGARKTFVTRTGDGLRRVEFDVNSDGFRGPELRPAGAARRVVVYGDSFVAATATRFEGTFPERLGAELRAAGAGDVEMVNAGVSGYGPDQALLRMESELPRLRPDAVVVTVLAENDYGDLVRNRLFSLDASGALVRRRPIIAPSLRETFDAAGSGPLVLTVARRAAEGLAAALSGGADAPRPSPTLDWLALCEIEHRRAVEDADPVVTGVLEDWTDEDVRLVPRAPSARYKVALMERVLGEIRDCARRHGVPLVLVVVPAAADACPARDFDRADPALFPEWRRDNLSAPVARAAAALGVPCVTLLGPFRDADPDSLYLRGDTHWNEAGQALAARLVAPRVREVLRPR